MDKFLDFLANNYVYFLIVAGVLAFALIGFIVDMKKKGKKEEQSSVTPAVVETPIVSDDVQTNTIPVQEPTVADPIIPGPPSPTSLENTTVVDPFHEATPAIDAAPISMEPAVTPEVANSQQIIGEPITSSSTPIANEPVFETTQEPPILDLSGISNSTTSDQPVEDTPIINVEEIK